MTITVHSWRVPVLFESNVEDGKKYLITSEKGWMEVPPETTYDDLNWIKIPISDKQDKHIYDKNK